MDDIKALIGQIDLELNDPLLANDYKKKKYAAYKEKLSEIKSVLEISGYKIVFIGDIGIGKTATLLSMFGLVDVKIGDLLLTGSGRTTICEVEVLPSNCKDSVIKIEPMEDDYFEGLVYSFCLTYKVDYTLFICRYFEFFRL